MLLKWNRLTSFQSAPIRIQLLLEPACAEVTWISYEVPHRFYYAQVYQLMQVSASYWSPQQIFTIHYCYSLSLFNHLVSVLLSFGESWRIPVFDRSVHKWFFIQDMTYPRWLFPLFFDIGCWHGNSSRLSVEAVSWLRLIKVLRDHQLWCW